MEEMPSTGRTSLVVSLDAIIKSVENAGFTHSPRTFAKERGMKRRMLCCWRPSDHTDSSWYQQQITDKSPRMLILVVEMGASVPTCRLTPAGP